ncbi:MAG: hypothetical protein OH337_04185 [Candidatus Parvarchaeota archaeon]|nr:hypothetical protein [Candidatus Haiyanarchaeum thermophilum]
MAAAAMNALPPITVIYTVIECIGVKCVFPSFSQSIAAAPVFSSFSMSQHVLSIVLSIPSNSFIFLRFFSTRFKYSQFTGIKHSLFPPITVIGVVAVEYS